MSDSPTPDNGPWLTLATDRNGRETWMPCTILSGAELIRLVTILNTTREPS